MDEDDIIEKINSSKAELIRWIVVLGLLQLALEIGLYFVK